MMRRTSSTRKKVCCPQKLFELLEIAERFEILSMKRELISDALESLVITIDNVIFVAKVASEYKRIFDEVSKKLLMRCLKFLLKQIKAGDTWTRFWALINNNNNNNEVLPIKERLAGTPFVKLTILISDHYYIKFILDKVGTTLYEECLHLACSGVDVR